MITKRNVYLNMKTLEEARQILFDHFPGTGSMATETVSPPDAVGRVIAEEPVGDTDADQTERGDRHAHNGAAGEGDRKRQGRAG